MLRRLRGATLLVRLITFSVRAGGRVATVHALSRAESPFVSSGPVETAVLLF